MILFEKMIKINTKGDYNLMLIIGFVLLIVGADLLVKGSSNIAKNFNIPEMLIGLTIVAIGTSMPELIITISSASNNATDLIIGNAIGSNLCNLLLIMGITAFLRPIEIDNETRLIHLPVLLFSTIIVLVLGLGIFGRSNNILNRTDGIILVVLYILYFLYPIIIEIKDIKNSVEENKKKHIKSKNILLSLFLVVLGIVLLKIGGDLVVNKSTEIAIKYGVSERVIGLTIVAIGTALPELITSIIAVIKKEGDLAEGNLIGSCILNSFLILGTGAIITPLNVSIEFIYNLILLAFSILLIWMCCSLGKKNTITRPKAILLLMTYLGYMISLFK